MYHYRSERWKKIPTTIYPCNNNGQGNYTIYHPLDTYEVSNLGRIRNRKTKHIISVRDYKTFSQVTLRGRYEFVRINEHNWWLNTPKSISFSVARLVAAAFIYGTELKSWYSVRHIDHNPNNNCLENLDVKY